MQLDTHIEGIRNILADICWVHCTCPATQGCWFGAAKQLSKCNRMLDTGHGTWSKGVHCRQESRPRGWFSRRACRPFVISVADLGVVPRSALYIQFISTTTSSFRCIFALASAPHWPRCVATQLGTRKSAVRNAATHAPETRFGARPRHALGCNASAQRAARGSNTLLTLILSYGRVCMCMCANVC